MLSSWCAKMLGERRWNDLLSLDYNGRLYACNAVGQLPSFALRHRVYAGPGRMRIGEGSSIHRGLRLFCLGGVTIGRRTIINGECWLDGREGLTIGDNVSVSIGCRLLTLGHDVNSSDFAPKGAPVIVEDYAWLGAFATLLPGVRLGVGSVVGAGAVVTKDVADYAIVAGSPARVVGERNRKLDYQLGHSPWFF